jgi:hypothetical protein
VFVTTLDDLERHAKTENIEIFNRQIFKDDPSAAVTNLKRQVKLWRGRGAYSKQIGLKRKFSRKSRDKGEGTVPPATGQVMGEARQ